jgi:hypothetical protein
MNPRRTATCSCGQLRLETDAHPLRISICHCLACQRRTGSAFGVQARFPADRVRIDGASTEYVRAGDSGGRITFHFCASCGATVYYRLAALPDSIVVPVGAFAEPSFPEPTFSVYEARRHPWVSLPTVTEHMD